MPSANLGRQWLSLITALLILGGTIGWSLYTEYKSTDVHERERLVTQTQVVDKNLEQQLTATNHALNSIRHDLPTLRAEKDGLASLKHRLEVMRGAMPTTRAITIFDADGTLIARSPDQFVGQNFSDREYFQAARQGGNQARLYIAAPFLAKTGEYVLNMSKGLLDERGVFAGVILVSLGPEYFDTLLKSVLYASDMRSMLIHGDGKIILSATDPQGLADIDLAAKPGSFFSQHMKSGQLTSMFQGISDASGDASLTVFHTIQPAAVPIDKPLVIAVSRERSALFAPWREDVVANVGLFVMLALATNLGLFFYQKRQLVDALLLAVQEAKRKQAEDALRESEENLAITLNSIGDAVIATDAAGRVTRMNQAAERLSGWMLVEALNRQLSEVFHIINAVTRETVPDPVNLVMTHGMVVGLANHTILRGRDGQEYQISDSAAPIRNANGEIFGMVLVFSDVTEKYRAEEALHLTRFSLEAVSDALFWIRPDARIVDANAAACRALGYTREELIQLSVPDVDAYYSVELWSQHFVELRQRGSMTFESEHRTRDGRLIPVEIVANYLKYGGKEYNCAFVRDITERKRAVEERAVLEIRLRQSEKMEAIGTLAGGIAHDFNNILAAIFGFTELAMDDGEPEQRIQNLKQVLLGAKRAKELVKQILAFSRQTTQDRQPLQIALFIKEAMKMLRSSIPSTIEIKQDIASNSTVLADPTQIHQIIMNLCTNAYHAMRETGGTLAVSANDMAIREGDKGYGALVPGRYMEIEVSDTGCGITPEIQEKIFEPYFTTKKTGEGTGLGLAVVHGIVQSYNGHITVYSELGQGTTFRIYLPLLEEKAVVLPPVEEVVAELTGQGERIMFVDDEAQICEFSDRLFSMYGYKVTTFSNGLEAWTEFQNYPGQYDLVITDMTMPYMTGAELVQKILGLNPDLPIILCTGQSELINREGALAMGICDYLNKPVMKQDFLVSIHKALNKKKTIPSTVKEAIDDAQAKN